MADPRELDNARKKALNAGRSAHVWTKMSTRYEPCKRSRVSARKAKKALSRARRRLDQAIINYDKRD